MLETQEVAAIHDGHGVVIRCEKYPLMPGDTFTLFSDQVRGTYDNCVHTAIPGEYVIHSLPSPGELFLQSCKSGELFRCSCLNVRAILGNWSDYQRGPVSMKSDNADNVVAEVAPPEEILPSSWFSRLLGRFLT